METFRNRDGPVAVVPDWNGNTHPGPLANRYGTWPNSGKSALFRIFFIRIN